MARSEKIVVLLGVLLLTACPLPSTGADCFEDAHCGPDLVCLAGSCEAPDDEDEEDTAAEDDDGGERLDVGNGIGGETTCTTAAFIATNAGCEFWAVDLPNISEPGRPYSLDIPAEQTFAVVVANVAEDRNATVSVFAGNESAPLEEATVGPLGTYAFLLSNALQIDGKRNGAGRAFRVESDVPITAYQFQPLDNLTPVFSNDASSLLPAHVLQTDYIAMTERGTNTTVYPSGFEAAQLPTGAFVTVVATQDNTRVTLDPTDVLVPGAWESVVLGRGQTFTILSDPSNNSTASGSLSGTRIRSDKPVAAFSGNVAASVPEDATECCLDHVEHQLLPTVSWGTRYVAAPPPHPYALNTNDPMVVRVVGAVDGTQLRYPAGRPSGAPDSIDAHREVAFSTTEAFVIESGDPDKPFAIALFLYNGGEARGASEDAADGDPAMIVVPAVEQLMDRYVFLTPPGYRSHTVTVVAPTDAEVVLDGEVLGGSTAIGPAGGITWGYRRATVGPGAHVVSADEPVSVTVVGYDQNVSYAYAGGSAVEAISDIPPAP